MLGILGLVLLVLSLGLLAILSLPMCIAAWIMGRKAVARTSGEAADGAGLARAGLILGRVGTALSVLALIAWTVLIALADDIFEDIEEWLEDLDDDGDGDPDTRPDGEGTFVRVRVVAAVLRAGAQMLPL